MVKSNSELVFYYGPMGCGKTRDILKKLYSLREDGFYPVIMKPASDKKGGDSIVSRDNGSVKVDFLIGNNDNIFNIISRYIIDYPLDTILVDEAQFLSDDQVKQLTDVVDVLGIDVICYGLLTDFKGLLFPGSKCLIENSDKLIEIERTCSCGNKKAYNARYINGEFVLDGDQVAIDGHDATYNPVCRRCYKKLVRAANYRNNNK